MLPAYRTAGEGFAMPTFDVVPSDVEGFMLTFRTVMSASIQADLRMMPHESALFSSGCKLTSL
jgi:hypothetical protein